MENFLHCQTRFLNAHDNYYTTIVYIHYIFFPSYQFNSRKIVLCHLMLKVTNFPWLWVSWVSFACWFLVFVSCYYFFFFSYSCIVDTTGTITITSNNVNKRERHWKQVISCEVLNFGASKGGRSEQLQNLFYASFKSW
jgi:hypothetical protein